VNETSSSLASSPRIHPAYDPIAKEWFADLGGSEVVAKTLRQMQSQFPGSVIVGYHPIDYSSPCIISLSQFAEVKPKRRFVVSTKAPPRVAPKPPLKTVVKYDEVLDLVARGKGTRSITEILGCTVGAVQTHKLEGLRRSDPRIAPRRVTVRTQETWTAEQDSALTKMILDGMTAADIGMRIGRTKNAVIGRSHRLKVKLQGRGTRSQSRDVALI